MQLLVIGGTRFLGRHIVEAALEGGHQVTLFNRGRSGPAPAAVDQLTGDRRSDLSALAGGSWDAVVDTCGYLPGEVGRMADALQGCVGCYVFVSSVSVYADSSLPNVETDAVGTIDDPETELVDGRTYGPLKALCERAVLQRFGTAALVLRPGLIVGPHDPTQRFTYWPARFGRARDGDTVLAPGRPSDPVQLIDARDIAAFTLQAISGPVRGVFNLVSAPGATTMGDVMAACGAAAGVAPTLRWVPVPELQALGLEPWTDLPLALPDTPDHAGFMATDVSRALAAGLVTRQLADTVADTLAWFRSLPPAQQVFDKAGLSPERETAALDAAAR